MKANTDIVHLTRLVTESVQLYAVQKGIRLTFQTTLNQKVIAVDEEKYERILLNLLSNAIKFTPAGETVQVSLRKSNGMVNIEVKDTGVGIPDNKQELIFERFGQVDSSLTRQAEGTGIGLTIVKLFVTALGGTVSVKSRVGSGTVFTVKLPDKKILQDTQEEGNFDADGKKIIEAVTVEFSDIYF